MLFPARRPPAVPFWPLRLAVQTDSSNISCLVGFSRQKWLDNQTAISLQSGVAVETKQRKRPVMESCFIMAPCQVTL